MRLREIRKQNGMTMKELAGILGVTKSAVSNWENGIRSPKVSDLCQIARVLGCTPNDLLGFEAEEDAEKREAVS